MKRRNLVLLAAASLAAFIAGPVVAATDTPDGRVIVKFREGSALKQIQAAGRVQSIASRLGLSARFIGQPSPDLHVMQASGIDAETLAARLGKDLTPYGAELAGNADGSIPAWDGGLTAPPAGVTFDPNAKGYPDPFASDQPLFTITSGNAGSYGDKIGRAHV